MATPPLALRDPLEDPSFSYETSPGLFLFTSLTSGSSHIFTATSRLETILKANRVPFRAVDIATDEKARRIWTRRAGKRKIPGLVKEGMILGDLEQVEEWNEFGEIKENLGGGATAKAPQATQPSQAAQSSTTTAPAASFSTAASDASYRNTTSTPPIQPSISAKETAARFQQAQQSALAAEAAAAAAARKKLKPASTISSIPSAATASSSNTSKPSDPSTPEPTQLLSPPSRIAFSPGLSAEEEAAIAFSDDSPPHHNTSSSAGLPPLSLRTKTTSPPTTGILSPTEAASDTQQANRGRNISITYPSAPPPTAIEPMSPSHTEQGLPNSAIAKDGAAPAGKSGLEAVSEAPKMLARAMAGVPGAEAAEGEGDAGLKGEEEAKEAEDQDVLEEEPTGREKEEKENAETTAEEAGPEESLGSDGHAQHVKFEGDQAKGSATDEEKAEESVLD